MVRRRTSARRTLFFAARLGGYRFVLLSCLGLLGCSHAASKAPEVTVSQIASYPSLARGHDCAMPILYSEPRQQYARIAIIEGWAGADESSELLAQIRQRACETGADALLVVENRSQVSQRHLYANPAAEEAANQTSGSSEGMTAPATRSAQRMGEAEEEPHSGSYIDAVAIVYRKKSN